MASTAGASNKAKIAKRVIEVLEFFDDSHPEATVMDIVRRYGRPQSSTSELLASLVDLGMLHKNPYTRSYRPTARAALLGTAGQAGAVRDGRLVRLIDRLVAQTGLSVAVFGKIGVNVQVVSLRQGSRGPEIGLLGGSQTPLAFSAAGWLLLSTVPQQRADGMVRRMIAEAPESRRFAFAEMSETLHRCRAEGHVQGQLGFGTKGQAMAVLVPGGEAENPLAVGFVYPTDAGAKSTALLDCLKDAVGQLRAGDEPPAGELKVLQAVA